MLQQGSTTKLQNGLCATAAERLTVLYLFAASDAPSIRCSRGWTRRQLRVPYSVPCMWLVESIPSMSPVLRGVAPLGPRRGRLKKHVSRITYQLIPAGHKRCVCRRAEFTNSHLIFACTGFYILRSRGARLIPQHTAQRPACKARAAAE